MAKWVKLPDGAQVTMNREDYEATQGLSFGTLVVIGALIVGVLWLLGHSTHTDSKPAHNPRPHTTTSAPVRIDHG